MKHDPHSAARAVRAMLEHSIARTWADFDAHSAHLVRVPAARRPGDTQWANAYQAGLLVCEQVGGVHWRETRPNLFEEVAPAVAEAMPELFASYWETLPDDPKPIAT